MGSAFIGQLKAVDWKKAGLLALAGAAGIGVSVVAKKKWKSTPVAVAAGAATVPASLFLLWYGMEKLGMSGLVMENVSGLVMENVGALADLRTRSALGDYRGLVMENVAGLYDYAT